MEHSKKNDDANLNIINNNELNDTANNPLRYSDFTKSYEREITRKNTMPLGSIPFEFETEKVLRRSIKEVIYIWLNINYYCYSLEIS